MASFEKILFCTLCHEDGISNDAVIWCIDCETFLCSDCKLHHGRIKATKEHRVISIIDYQNLPSIILETSNRCDEHDKRYELYCRFHESACCVQCLDDKHKECRDLAQLSNVLGNIKSSARLVQLENDLKDIGSDFEEVRKYLTKLSTTLPVEKSQCIEKIQRMRKSINDHLDKIEKTLLEDLSLEYTKIQSKTDALFSTVMSKARLIDQIQADFTKMNTFATDLQTFLATRTIEKMKNEEFMYLEGIRTKGELDELHLNVNMSSALNSIIDDVQSFGNISVPSTPVSLQLKTGTKMNEQMHVSHVQDISQITPKLKMTFKIPKKSNMNITGCQILPDGRMLFVDRNNKCLMLFSKDGVYTRNVIIFKSYPWDVCCIKENIVAVTLYENKAVELVDLSENKITQTIPTDGMCYGLDLEGEGIFVSCLKPDIIHRFDLQGLQKLPPWYIKTRFPCIAVFENKLYCAGDTDNTISCYLTNGELLWNYENNDIRTPYGLSLDRHGFIR